MIGWEGQLGQVSDNSDNDVDEDEREERSKNNNNWWCTKAGYHLAWTDITIITITTTTTNNTVTSSSSSSHHQCNHVISANVAAGDDGFSNHWQYSSVYQFPYLHQPTNQVWGLPYLTAHKNSGSCNSIIASVCEIDMQWTKERGVKESQVGEIEKYLGYWGRSKS